MSALGHDLRQIREFQKRTLEDIQKETRLSIEVLRSIEDGTLFTSPDHSETYIRSFVRAFGKALAIPDHTVLQALDTMKAGRYDSDLLRDVLQAKPAPKPSGGKRAAADDATLTLELPTEESRGAQVSIPSPPTVGSVDWAAKTLNRRPVRLHPSIFWVSGLLVVVMVVLSLVWLFRIPIGDALQAGQQTPPQTESPVSTQNAQVLATSEQGASPGNGSATGSLDETSNPDEFNPTDPLGSGEGPTAATGSVAAADLEASDPNRPIPQNSPNRSDGAPSDPGPSTGRSATTRAPASATPPAADAIEVVVHAAGGILEGLIVSSDLRPEARSVSLNAGEAIRLAMADSLLMSGPTSRVTVYVNGWLVNDVNTLFFDRATRRVVIRRSDLESFVARGVSSQLQTPPGVNPPDTVLALP